MAKMMIAIVAALIAACAVPHNKAEPQVPTVDVQAVQEPEAVPAAHTPQPTSYLVRINFVFYTDEVAANPVASHAFEEALMVWVNDLPVQCGVYMDEGDPFHPMPAFVPTVSNIPGIIHVRIGDINGAPWFMEKGVLGFWDYTKNNLVLDKTILNADPDLAYSVCLHELGHVFGLPHIENESATEALSGELMIPDEFDASRMVMFPFYDPDKNKRATLSKLEIEFARENLLGLQELLHNGCLGLTLK